MGTEHLGEKMPHFGLGITEDAEGGKDPASEKCAANFGHLNSHYALTPWSF